VGFFIFGIYLSLLLGLVGSIQPSNMEDIVVASNRNMNKSWGLVVWKMVPLAILWAIWKDRN